MHPKKKQKSKQEKEKKKKTETALPSFSHAKTKSPSGEGDKCGGICIGTFALTLKTGNTSPTLHYTLYITHYNITTWTYKPTATLL